MKQLSLVLLVLLFSIPNQAQDVLDCYNGRYKELVFDEYDFIDNVIYARKKTSSGVFQDIGYDVYLPKGDTATNRPVVMLAHGGGYIDFIDQKSPDIIRLAQDLVARGYVVISVEYREEKSPLSLLSEENMVKAVGRSLIDIRDVTCKLMDTTLLNNPYGIDPSKVVVGGVSAGAVSFIHAIFLDSLTWMPKQYQEWILEVEPNTQALLDNKYCGASVLGLINISGAILDTSWIKDYKINEYPAMMHVHGTNDGIVPYGYARPFGIRALPYLMGSSIIDQRAQSLGLRSELDTYKGAGHVPIFGFDLTKLFSNNPLDFIFNNGVLNKTLDHMGEFIYSLIDCNEIVTTPIRFNVVDELGIYPNPVRETINIRIPNLYQNRSGLIRISNTLGQIVYFNEGIVNQEEVQLNIDLPNGMYQVVMAYDKDIFTGQIMVAK